MASIAQQPPTTTVPPTAPAAHSDAGERAVATPLPLGLAGVLTVCAVLLATGQIGSHGAPLWLQATALGALALVDLRVFARRFSASAAPATGDLAAGLLALVTLHAALRFSGPLLADLHPLSYVLAAYLATVNEPRVGTPLIAAALALEVVPFLLGHPLGLAPDDTARLLLRVGFIATFATLYVVFHRTSILRSRRALERQQHERTRRNSERAHELRLLAADANPSLHGAVGADDDSQVQLRERLLTGAIEACERNSRRTLALLREAIGARTVALLAVRTDGATAELRESISDVAHLARDPVSLRAGVLGGIFRERRTVRLSHVRRDLPCYAPGQTPATGAFLGVPVLEGERLVAVLCVDRERDTAFTAHEEKLAATAAAQLARAIGNERLFLQMERARHELHRVFDASRALSSALDLQSVLATSLETLRSIAGYDGAAITLYDAARGTHEVALVRGRALDKLQGHTFADNKGLVAQVVRMRHHLPVGADHRPERAVVFDRASRLRGIHSLLVLPLIARDRAIGTIVLAQARPQAFADAQHRQMLEVVANQVAVALANAQMYARMELLATTDGLTGLLNRRTFLEHYETAVARCARSGRRASVILTDIDFFKKVNDTYGHPTGDEVIRRVAATLTETLRCTDIVGRYGGEEFVLLLEDTDTDGALQMAERLRHAVAALEFASPQGTFSVSISLGVSTYEVDATCGEALIERADQALYACKQAGRNCALASSQLPARASGVAD